MSLDERFLAALFGSDELGVVVRAHIHIEARLNALLDALVPYSDDLPRLRFEQRLKLAIALGLKDDSTDAIKELGNIRNRFGHKLDTTLTAKMVNKVLEGLSIQDEGILIQGYDETRKKVPMAPFENLNPKDQFIVLCVGIDQLLVKAISEATSGDG